MDEKELEALIPAAWQHAPLFTNRESLILAAAVAHFQHPDLKESESVTLMHKLGLLDSAVSVLRRGTPFTDEELVKQSEWMDRGHERRVNSLDAKALVHALKNFDPKEDLIGQLTKLGAWQVLGEEGEQGYALSNSPTASKRLVALAAKLESLAASLEDDYG